MDSHPILECVADIGAALKSVGSVDPVFMSVPQQRAALVDLEARIAQLEELRMRVCAASDPVAKTEGYRSIGSWMARNVRRDGGRMRGIERLASDLDRRYHRVAAGLAEGRVNLDQAFVVVAALNDLDDSVDSELLGKAEAHLVEACGEFAPRQLRRLGRKILEVVAEDLYDDQERQRLERELARARAATRLRIRNRRDGTCEIQGRLPEAAGARLRTLLEAFTSPRQHHLAGPGLRDQATGERLPADRVLGEALCSLLERIDPAALPQHGGSTTTVVVTIDLHDLLENSGVGVMADGTPITAGEVRRLACNAGIIPAVLGGKSEVLDLGRSQRLFSAPQRLAMAIEHPHCRAEGCTVPAAWCEAHHRRAPWAQDGRTDLADGELLCSWHHHRAHDEAYITKRLPNGDVRFHKRR